VDNVSISAVTSHTFTDVGQSHDQRELAQQPRSLPARDRRRIDPAAGWRSTTAMTDIQHRRIHPRHRRRAGDNVSVGPVATAFTDGQANHTIAASHLRQRGGGAAAGRAYDGTSTRPPVEFIGRM
jgi:hypothetical protein